LLALRCFLSGTCGRCATNKYFQIIGSIHDIESYFGIDNTSSLNVQIFFSHWGHLAIIFVWVSRNLFHIGWNGNYELWVLNPIATIPIAHGIWDPHFASALNSDYTIVLSSGIYNWLYTVGFNSVFHLYNFVIICELLAVISIPLGKVHLIYNEELLHWHKEIIHFHKKLALDISLIAYFDLVIWACFRLEIIIGFLSIAWCGHLVDYAIPISRAINVYWFNTLTLPSLKAFIKFNLIFKLGKRDVEQSTYYPLRAAGLPILTFLGGLKSNTISLYLTDIAHHHLGVGILFVSKECS
jgi:photosystem I P700 chlorophyll a apoprotein A2